MNQCHHHHHHRAVTGPGRLPSWGTPSASPSWCDGGQAFWISNLKPFEVIATGGKPPNIQHLVLVYPKHIHVHLVSSCYVGGEWTSQHPAAPRKKEAYLNQLPAVACLISWGSTAHPRVTPSMRNPCYWTILDLNPGGWWNPIDNYDIWWLVTNYGPSYF